MTIKPGDLSPRMSWRHLDTKLFRSVAWALVVVLCAGIGAALADSTVVKKGEKAPATGVLLDEKGAKKSASDLRELKITRVIMETQAAQIAAQQRQIIELLQEVKELKDEARKQEIALAISKDRDERRKEDQERLIEVLSQTKDVLKANKDALERADKRIEKLEDRQFWSSILGPLGVVIALVASSGF